MRLLFKAKYIILSILFFVALMVGTKYGWLVQRYTFSKTLENGFIPKNVNKSDLNRCLRTCTPKDKAFASRFLDIVTDIESGKATLEQEVGNLRTIISLATNNYIETGDVQSAVEMHSAALVLDETPGLENVHDVNFMNDVYVGIERLVAKYPRNGHAYFALGTALYQKNPRDERALGAFKKCLLILPTESACQAGYDKAAKAFTTAHCAPENFAPEVNFILTSQDPAKSQTLIAATDIEEISPAASDVETVLVALKESGRAKLSAAVSTEPNVAMQVKLGESIVATSRALAKEKLSSPQSLIRTLPEDSSKKNIFERLCLKPVKNILPQSLML